MAHQARGAVRGLGALATALRPAARSSLSGPLSAERRFAVARTSVDDVAAVRHALGGTFNDVVLAAVTTGFRRLLLSRGELPTQHAVRTLVPVSVRPPGRRTSWQPGVAAPRRAAGAAGRPGGASGGRPGELTRLKAEHEAQAGAAVLDLAAYEPFAAAAVPVRLAAHLPQRSVVTVTTNVPGPREPLYALGRRLVEIVPYVPIASTLRFGVAIFSYCGQVTVGITGDYDGAADVWTLAEGIEEGMAELVATAGARRPAARRHALTMPEATAEGGAVVNLATTSLEDSIELDFATACADLAAAKRAMRARDTPAARARLGAARPRSTRSST